MSEFVTNGWPFAGQDIRTLLAWRRSESRDVRIHRARRRDGWRRRRRRCRRTLTKRRARSASVPQRRGRSMRGRRRSRSTVRSRRGQRNCRCITPRRSRSKRTDPALAFKTFFERLDASLGLRVVCEAHQHPNGTHAKLLRIRGDRVSGQYAAEQADELAPPHGEPTPRPKSRG